jgi:phosphoglycerate dehydrogenase-like enzyme
VFARIEQLRSQGFKVDFLESQAKLLEQIGTADAIINTYPINREVLAHAPNLRVVGHFGVGYDPVDVDACSEKNVVRSDIR